MYAARPEFALGEFGLFEFALDRSTPGEFAFGAFGTATADLHVGATAQVGLASSGSSSMLVDAQTVSRTTVHVQVEAEVGVQAGATASATAYAPGIGALQADQGYVGFFTFGFSGSSDAVFRVAADPGFDVRGSSETQFFSEVTANIDLVFGSSASVQFVAQAVSSADADMVGSADIALLAGTTAHAQAALFGSDSFAAQVQLLTLTAFQAHGVGAAATAAQMLGTARVAAQGRGTTAFATAPLQRVSTEFSAVGGVTAVFDYQYRGYAQTVFGMRGSARLQLNAQAQRWTRLAAIGNGAASWVRGREVLPYLNPAFDVVMRPAENRLVVRGGEDRAARHPAETRTVEWTR